MRSREIVIPILNSEYKVIVLVTDKWNYTLNKVNEWGYEVDERYVKDAMDGRRGVTYRKSGCHPVVVVPGINTPDQVGTLAHEAVHAIDFIFGYIGESSTDEVFAISVGAVVRETLAVCGYNKCNNSNGGGDKK